MCSKLIFYVVELLFFYFKIEDLIFGKLIRDYEDGNKVFEEFYDEFFGLKVILVYGVFIMCEVEIFVVCWVIVF